MSTETTSGFTHVADAKKMGLKTLTQEQVDHFMEKGYVILRGGIPKESMDKFKHDVWVRLAMDPNDRSTWNREELHMPHHRREHLETFAPMVWGAICDLLGGADKVDYKAAKVGNGFIANFGSPDFDPEEIVDPRDLTNWHVDGDWFRHFLDTECQSLETLILWSDVEARAGPTYICLDGVKKVAEWLRDRPEGLDVMIDENGDRIVPKIVKTCNQFDECIGKTGDVFICHPLMPHSRQRNYKRNERFITNPCLNSNDPFIFNRSDPSEYSLVELKTLKELGVNSLDFKITRPRARWVPTTLNRANALIEEEVRRMKEHSKKTGIPVDSMHEEGVDNSWLLSSRKIALEA